MHHALLSGCNLNYQVLRQIVHAAIQIHGSLQSWLSFFLSLSVLLFLLLLVVVVAVVVVVMMTVFYRGNVMFIMSTTSGVYLRMVSFCLSEWPTPGFRFCFISSLENHNFQCVLSRL